MGRPPEETLTGREAQIMETVWRLGEATADSIREALPEALHDSTVRTLLRVLETKGYLRHQIRGRAFVYRAMVERTKAQRHALRNVLSRFFGGSVEDLVLRLIEDEQITPEQLDALRQAAPAPQPQGARARRRKETGQ